MPELKEKTKEQLIVQIEQMESNKNVESDGWLVTTPDPEYTGMTCRIPFANGMAFLTKPEWEERVVKKGVDGNPDRIEVHPTLMALRDLEFGFGYKVEAMTAAEFHDYSK